MSPEAKTERFNLRLSAAELRMVNEVADAQGVSASDVIRMLIRREHAEMVAEGRTRRTKH